MKTVMNKTSAPIRVPLSRNKTLRLGPGKSGQVSDDDAARPALAKMVEVGQLEISDGGGAAGTADGRGGTVGKGGRSGGTRSIGRRGGDR